ncbi:MAG: hypothetical protein U9Q37_08025, partial [Euryarchaeota archaeon]|nr:hypothetical protein [Euryarchaeota archaeon]
MDGTNAKQAKVYWKNKKIIDLAKDYLDYCRGKPVPARSRHEGAVRMGCYLHDRFRHNKDSQSVMNGSLSSVITPRGRGAGGTIGGDSSEWKITTL